MEYATEYREQRTGFRHFIDLARVMGIEVTRLANSGLSFEPVPYPFIQDDPLLNKLSLRQRQTKMQLNNWNESLRLTRTMIAQNEAVISILKEQEKTDKVTKKIESLEKEKAELLKTSANLSKDITIAEGAHQEQSWLKDYLHP
jgi:post-segregation antitoxin (ccd killing protein)